MKNLLTNADDWTRRLFVERIAKSMLGVGMVSSSLSRLSAAPSNRNNPGRGRANRVIYLYLSGGMSHLDTLDTKPGADNQGPVETIDTAVDGIRISEYLPEIARHMDKAAIIRSMSSNQGAHERGRYYMRTGYNQRGTIRHPAMGAWMLKLGGRLNQTLPGNVRIGGDSRHPGAGFMEASFSPLPIGNPTAGLQYSGRPKGVDEELFSHRVNLAKRLDQSFGTKFDQRQVRAYANAYDEAIRLMKSSDLKAFDLSGESNSLREAYGDNAFGQGCLLARRLAERDVRFIEVSLGGWDTHQGNFDRLPERCRTLDQGLSTLLGDLSSRGMLEETLVVVATEFGRTPKINQNR